VKNYKKDNFRARELLYTWALRDFKMRYSQLIWGAAWAIIQSFSLMVVFSDTFSSFLKIPTNKIPYPLFSFVALLPWTFFSNSLSFAIPSQVNNINLVRKIYFAKEIWPLPAFLVFLIEFPISFSIFVLMMLWYQTPVSWTLIFIPLVLLIHVILIFRISLFVFAINVFYRIIQLVLSLMIKIRMYLSPAIYPVEIIPQRLKPVCFIIPVSTILESYRRMVLYQQEPYWIFQGFAAIISISLVFVTYPQFKRTDRQFADLI
jgi:lipopolysaccharide transport system permease protein